MGTEPATDILEATYHTLSEYGYADLTLQDIAAEADTSKASIHYYYGSKEQLFVALVDFLYERHADNFNAADDGTPSERLDSLLRTLLTDEAGTSDRKFRTAMLEMQAQAPYHEAIRDRLADFDDRLFDQFRGIVEAGIETGTFDSSVDPASAAALLVTTVRGAHVREVAVNHSSEQLYATVSGYAEAHLLADRQRGVVR